MSLWQGKSKGNKAGYQFFVWILKNFGVLPAYAFLRLVVLYFCIFSFKASRQIYRLYHDRMGYGRIAALHKLFRNYYFLGQSIIDKVVVMSGIANKFTFNFDGEDNLRDITAHHKGGILLSAHIGNWDIAGHLFTRLQTRIHIVMYDGEAAQIKAYLDQVTGPKSIHIIFIKDDLSHIYQISEAFKNNELVCMHADRYVTGNKTITTPFLGEPAQFPIGPFVLAATFKVPVSYVFAVKETHFHYHFFASAIKDYSALTKTEVVQTMVVDFAAEMEVKLKQYPEQWFNYYDFWHH